MAIQSDNTALSKGDLKAYHERILPYLGGNFMMQTAVSDYYSTDEKVVGIWIDGKPIYQKVIPVTLTSALRYEVNHNVPNLEHFISISGIIYALDKTITYGNFCVPLPCLDLNSNPENAGEILIDENEKIILAFKGNWTGWTAFIKIKYTKTTDTATSALTTPGAYDLNRPDLWPANKEIFFGNGLYGYRYKKTDFNVTAGTIKDEIIFSSTTSNFRIISSGGQFGSTGAYQILGGDFVHNSNGTLKHMMGCTMFRSGDGANPFYIRIVNVDWSVPVTQCDVWVTYTK